MEVQVGVGALELDSSTSRLSFPLAVEVTSRIQGEATMMGTWSKAGGWVRDAAYSSAPVRRFLRVGTVARTPWTVEGEGGQLSGYCVLMVEELAKRMQFDYEIILPTDGSNDFGEEGGDGEWGGVVGDLVAGQVDIVVAPMTMTSQREEVIDFVAPYFDQSGISIIIRKPVREQSLFKFMQVYLGDNCA